MVRLNIVLLGLLALVLAQAEPLPPPPGPSALRLAGSPAPPPPTPGLLDSALAVYRFNSAISAAGPASAPAPVVQTPAAVQWLGTGGLQINTPAVIRTPQPASALIAGLLDSAALTVELWIQPANVTQIGPARILALSQNGFPDGGNLVIGQSAGQYEVRLRTSQTNQYGLPGLLTPPGTATPAFTHIVYTRDAVGAARVYIDGVERASGMQSGALSNWGNYRLAIANEPSGGRAWLGTVYAVAVYDRAIDAATVAALFNARMQ